MKQRGFFDDYDPCRNRHGGNATSTAAHERGKKSYGAVSARILELIRAAGARGLTCDEAAEKMGVTPNQISGRFTTLSGKLKLIRPVGERLTRTGSRATVWVSAK